MSKLIFLFVGNMETSYSSQKRKKKNTTQKQNQKKPHPKHNKQKNTTQQQNPNTKKTPKIHTSKQHQPSPPTATTTRSIRP